MDLKGAVFTYLELVLPGFCRWCGVEDVDGEDLSRTLSVRVWRTGSARLLSGRRTIFATWSYFSLRFMVFEMDERLGDGFPVEVEETVVVVDEARGGGLEEI